jgi:hypothetical protein
MKLTNTKRIEALEKHITDLMAKIDKLIVQSNFIELGDSDQDKKDRAEREKGIFRYGH